MSIIQRCKLCAKTNVEFFAISGTVKTPLCSNDVSTFQSSHPTSSIFPIDSFYYIHTPDDYKHFQAYKLQMAKAIGFAEQLADKEKNAAQETIENLEKGKREVVESVTEDYDFMLQKFKSYHAGFETVLTEIRHQLDQGKDVKDYSFSPLTRALIKKSSETDHLSDIYKNWVQEALPMVKNVLTRSMRLPTAEPQSYLSSLLSGKDDLFAIAPQTQMAPNPYVAVAEPDQKSMMKPVQNGYVPPPFRVYPSSVNYQASQQGNFYQHSCQLCQIGLDASNSILSAGHETCHVCFGCISKATRTYVKCPVCKTGFPTNVRMSLEQRIPGLIKVISRKRLKKIEDSLPLQPGLGGDSCVECGSTNLTFSHRCPNNNVMCVICCQGTVIANFQSKPGCCPKCGIVYTEEVFADFNRAKHNCASCSCQLVLTNVADYYRDESGMSYYCYNCKARSEESTYGGESLWR